MYSFISSVSSIRYDMVLLSCFSISSLIIFLSSVSVIISLFAILSFYFVNNCHSICNYTITFQDSKYSLEINEIKATIYN